MSSAEPAPDPMAQPVGQPAADRLSVAVLATADVRGGAEAYLSDLYAGLAAASVDGTLVGAVPGWAEAGLAEVPAQVGPKWSRRSAVTSLRRLRADRAEYLRALDAVTPSAQVHHVQYKREQVLLTASLAARGPVLWTEHGRLATRGPHRGVMAAYRHAAPHAAAVVCVSTEVADDVRHLVGGSPTEIVTIPNAVDTTVFQPPSGERYDLLRSRLLPEAWRDRPVAVLASRLHPAKRHERAISFAAAAGLPLMVVGDGPDRARLETLAVGTETVFVGHRDDVPDLLAACDVYVFAGSLRSECGNPLALLEAAATGLSTVGFVGDEGSATLSACGGLLVSPGQGLPVGWLSEPRRTERRELARHYVVAHHDRRDWFGAYEELIRSLV